MFSSGGEYARSYRRFLQEDTSANAIEPGCLRAMRAGKPGVEVSQRSPQPRAALRKAHRTASSHRRGIEESHARSIYGGRDGQASARGSCEATALGNIAIQILATGEASSLQEVRTIVDRSFPTDVFEPVETDKWERQTERFEQYCEMIHASN